MIIDGTNLILGRLASYTAKKALLGEQIQIVNCEQVIMSASKNTIKEMILEKKDRGHPYTGPFYPKMPDRIVRRSIRGMLPYKQERGRTAYKRVMCYLGIPIKLKEQTLQTVPGANASKLQTTHSISLKDFSKYLGK